MTEPFEIQVPQAAIDDLVARVAATSWPPDLAEFGWDFGFNGAVLRDLAQTWCTDFDWRETERHMNAFAHFRAAVDGIPIHFIRQPGVGPAPIPLILTHGWPWTFWDMQKVIRPLADPASFGGDPADAFEVIVPSVPGFGFSTPLPRTGVNAFVVADLWQKLMTDVLGFKRYAAAGGDWGAIITSQLGHKYAGSLYGIHTVGVIPPDTFNLERYWDITTAVVPHDAPAELRDSVLPRVRHAVPHVAVQTIEPQTLAYAMHDSPVGMLAWLMQRRRDWGDTIDGDLESVFPRQHILETATLYWVTESFASSVRFYAEAIRQPWRPSHDRTPVIEAPMGVTFLQGENPFDIPLEQRAAAFRDSAEARRYNLHFLNAHARGGHFAHYENPEACIADIRATFRELRSA